MSNTPSAPLSQERIRQRLQQGDHSQQEGSDDQVAGLNPTPTPTRSIMPAAVLIAIVNRREPSILLTRRTAHLTHHAGQISFPGGRVEHHDRDAVAAALREAEEEIGLATDKVEIAGQLARYRTVTGFIVTPVVGFVEPPLALRPDPFEVADIFEVPLSFVLDRNNHQRHSRRFNNQERRYYALPFGDYYIWGATAAMLVNLANTLHVKP